MGNIALFVRERSYARISHVERKRRKEKRVGTADRKLYWTVPQVAEELQIPRTRAYELIQRGELPAVRIGERSIRVNRQ